MAPATKKAKTEDARYRCTSCDSMRLAKFFPNYCPTNKCKHLIHTCSACLKKWIVSQLDTKSYNLIKCPEAGCDHVMEGENVELFATKAVFARYDELERRHKADSTPGWRWCMSPGCRSGQVHEPPKKKGRGKKAVKDDICVCKDCGAKACVPCDRPWHEGENCDEYQKRLVGHEDEEKETLKTIVKKTKKCPSCAKNIEKNGGCPAMMCSQCGFHFCWLCLKPLVSQVPNGEVCPGPGRCVA